MDIVFGIDNNYVMPCGVTMISVLENNKDAQVTFHVIGMDLSEESKNQLLSISDLYKDTSVQLYDIKKEILESHKFSLYDSPHLSLASYSRLFIVDILPESIDKVLYLDSDMIVRNSLSELWDTNISDYAVAGVPDTNCMFNTNIYKTFGYSETFQYVNAGLLLINLKYWREQNLKQRFIRFYNENEDKLLFHDQDVINGTLYGSILALPMKYNVLDCHYSIRKDKKLNQYKEEVGKAILDPVIIHYTSPFKPWLKTCRHPLKKVFLKYKKMSPWKNVPLDWNGEPFRRRMRFYKRSLFYALGLRKPDTYVILRRKFWSKKYNFKL